MSGSVKIDFAGTTISNEFDQNTEPPASFYAWHTLADELAVQSVQRPQEELTKRRERNLMNAVKRYSTPTSTLFYQVFPETFLKSLLELFAQLYGPAKLVPMLKDSDKTLQNATRDVLLNSVEPPTYTLINFLDGADKNSNKIVADMLTKIGFPAVSILIASLRTTENPTQVVKILANIDPNWSARKDANQFIYEIINKLREEDKVIKNKAIKVMKAVYDDSVVDILISTLNCKTHNINDFFNAVINGEITKVKELIQQGIDVNAKDTKNGSTALMLAAEHGQEEIVSLLLNTNLVVYVNWKPPLKKLKRQDDLKSFRRLKANPKSEIYKITKKEASEFGLPVVPIIETILVPRKFQYDGKNVAPEAYLIIRESLRQNFVCLPTEGKKYPLYPGLIGAVKRTFDSRSLDRERGAQAGVILALSLDAMRNNAHLKTVISKLIDQTAKMEGITDRFRFVIFAWDSPVSKTKHDYISFFNSVIHKTILPYSMPKFDHRDNSGRTALDIAQQKGHRNIIDLLLKAESENGLVRVESSLK